MSAEDKEAEDKEDKEGNARAVSECLENTLTLRQRILPRDAAREVARVADVPTTAPTDSESPPALPACGENLQKTKAGTKCRRAVQLRVRRGRSETGCAPATKICLSRGQCWTGTGERQRQRATAGTPGWGGSLPLETPERCPTDSRTDPLAGTGRNCRPSQQPDSYS